ncbi:MAG: FAD:protein FMN transferase [Eubacterium sp.]|nr:FAD:protein FMN transferase [Eubacterium sp.]
MKKYIAYLMAILLMISVTGCSQKQGGEPKELAEDFRDVYAMDTYMTLKAYGKNCSKALDEAVVEIKRLDQKYSTGNPESEISQLNAKGEAYVSEETAYLFQVAKEIYDKAQGTFDVSVYPLMREWGFTNQKYKIPGKKELNRLLKNVDMSKIEFDEKSRLLTMSKGMEVDFGGIVKGYASQRIMQIFKKYQVKGGIVSLGGNVQTYGVKPENDNFVVGIEDPLEKTDFAGVLEVKDKAVITSGSYERFFEKDGKNYHHILNPKTGYPAESGLKSVTIVGEDGTWADGMSTALFVLGKEKAIQYWQQWGKLDRFDLILVEDDGTVCVTKGIAKAFSSEKEIQVIK